MKSKKYSVTGQILSYVAVFMAGATAGITVLSNMQEEFLGVISTLS